MDRCGFVHDLIAREFFWNRGSLIAGCIACLTPVETCGMLNLEFTQDYALRQGILRQIGRDMDRAFEDCHRQLIEDLMSVTESLPYNKKRSCAHCLAFLSDHLPMEVRKRVFEFLLNSKYVVVRRKAYGKLERTWNSDYEHMVSGAWHRWQDPACAALIVETFPLSYLQQHLVDLEKAIATMPPWHLPRLFLRVGEAESSVLERLGQIDEIGFAYVSAKLQYPISETRAWELFERNRLDERVGLLIWSFGQLNLWSVLTGIADQICELEQEKRSI